jgi:hypothetical protein
MPSRTAFIISCMLSQSTRYQIVLTASEQRLLHTFRASREPIRVPLRIRTLLHRGLSCTRLMPALDCGRVLYRARRPGVWAMLAAAARLESSTTTYQLCWHCCNSDYPYYHIRDNMHIRRPGWHGPQMQRASFPTKACWYLPCIIVKYGVPVVRRDCRHYRPSGDIFAKTMNTFGPGRAPSVSSYE